MPTRPPRHLACEALEGRDVPSTVSGIVFGDLNANGTRDPGEAGSAGVPVFLDANRNAVLDPGEASDTTDVDGNYSIEGVGDGSYSVAVAAPAFAQTRAGAVNGPGSGLLGEGRVGFASPEPGVSGGANNYSGIAWADGSMYVTHVGATGVTGDTHLYQVDPATGDVLTGPISIPDGIGDITFDGTAFWGADYGGDWLIRFTAAGTESARYQTGRDVNSVEWDGSSLWVVDNVGKTLYQVNPATGAVGTSLALPNANVGAVAFDGRNLWVNNRDTDRVFEVDPAGGAVLRSFAAPGDFAYGLGFDGQFLWLSDNRLGLIIQYDIAAPARVVMVAGDVSGVDLGLAALGSVSGTVFEDRNGSQTRDGGEVGLQGWRVYVDGNGNQQFDRWERSVLTPTDGSYALAALRPGATLALDVRGPGWLPTTPSQVGGSGTAQQVDFGVRQVGLGPVGPEVRVNETTAGDQGFPTSISGEGQVNSVAADALGNYVVVWQGAGPGETDGGVFARMYNADGSPRTPEFRVNLAATRPQRMPVVAMAANGVFAVAWSAWDAALGRYAAFARVYNANGTPRTGDIQVTAFGTKMTRLANGIAMDADGDFVVLLHGADFQGFWENHGLISFQRYNAQGQTQGKVIQVVDAGLINGSSSVAMDATGKFVVAWSDDRIYSQRYTATGTKDGARITTALPGFRPTVARNATGAFVVASGGAIQLFDANGTARTGAVAYDPGETNTRPALAIDAAGTVVVTWSRDGTGTDVRAQRFSSTGVALEPAFLVNTTLSGTQGQPSVAITARGFVVVWQGQSEAGDWDVFAQRFETPPV